MTEPKTRLFVIAAPSGAGKTTLVHATVINSPDLRFSISYTTRPQRSNESDGKDYHFVDAAKFEALRAEGDLLESATVFDNFYGTSRKQVEEILADGHNVVLEMKPLVGFRIPIVAGVRHDVDHAPSVLDG